MFSHEKLKVYDKALASVARLAQLSTSWDKRHSVLDHLLRASESIVLNIAEGARLWTAATKPHFLDYAIGSTLESAACLDLAVVKQFLVADLASGEKRALCEVVRMLVGLRKSWGNRELLEEPLPYGNQEEPPFSHERLKAYRQALAFMRWFHSVPGGAELVSRLYRQVDTAGTSIVLNIAEGNGRYPEGDRRNFVDIAEASAVKAAAYLDLCEHKEGLDSGERAKGVELLRQVASMVRGLARS